MISDASAPDRFERARKLMVASQLRPSGVDDPRIQAVMATVPREAFVPAERLEVAYADRPVPLGGGRELNAPTVTGLLLTRLRPVRGDRALLIGAATGYAAVLLARLVTSVVAVEENAALAAAARASLQGIQNIALVESRLAAGHAPGAPYDIIMIDGAVERIPNTIWSQLANGGRIAAATIENGVTRLVAGVRSGDAWGDAAFADADAVRLPGFGRAPAFTF